jgi:hypothetical protein
MSTLRFWRRKRIAPFVTANLSKSGVSLSLGERGAHYTVGPAGERVTVGLSGSGLFLTEKLNASKGAHVKPTYSTSPFRTDVWSKSTPLPTSGGGRFLYIFLRVLAWMVIAILAAVMAIVIAAHYH